MIPPRRSPSPRRSNFGLPKSPLWPLAACQLDTLNVPARQEMDAYTLVHLSAGIENESWSLGLYINNAFDERAEIDIADPGYGTSIPGYVRRELPGPQ